MSDADASAAAVDEATAAEVSPMVALWRRVEETRALQRTARALELAERALEEARRCLPADSLVLAWMLDDIESLHSLARFSHSDIEDPAHLLELVRTTRYTSDADARLLTLAGERLAVCYARLTAGTLRTLTAEDRAFFLDALCPARVPPLETLGEDMLVIAAGDAMFHYVLFRNAAPFELLVSGVRGALDAALFLETQDALDAADRFRQGVCSNVILLLRGVFGTGPKQRRMLSALRSGSSPLPPATIAALRRLDARLTAAMGDPRQLMLPDGLETLALAMGHVTANQDVARHGLHTCTLPACDATEPHPRFFKCCSRCRSVFYCSPEHQREDWPRHRAEDECSKAEAS